MCYIVSVFIVRIMTIYCRCLCFGVMKSWNVNTFSHYRKPRLITLHSSLHHDNTEHNQPWVPRMTFQCLLWDKHSTNTSLSLRLRSPPNSTLCVAGWALISSKHLFSCSFLSSAKSLVLSRWEVIREKATPLIWHWNENIVWLNNWYLNFASGDNSCTTHQHHSYCLYLSYIQRTSKDFTQ